MLRVDHNFAPETSIRDVAFALRRNVDEAALDRVLAGSPRAPSNPGNHDGPKERRFLCMLLTVEPRQDAE